MIMKQTQIERSYRIPAHALFGACLTALAHMHARIEAHDAERGTIEAVASSGPLAAATELELRIHEDGPAHARLVVSERGLKRGGDKRAVARLLELVDQLLSQV